jgi:hypothetical protein
MTAFFFFLEADFFSLGIVNPYFLHLQAAFLHFEHIFIASPCY